MNRKDFDCLAAAFKEGRRYAPVGYDYAIKVVANAIDKDCAHFDKAKFLERCGVKP